MGEDARKSAKAAQVTAQKAQAAADKSHEMAVTSHEMAVKSHGKAVIAIWMSASLAALSIVMGVIAMSRPTHIDESQIQQINIKYKQAF